MTDECNFDSRVNRDRFEITKIIEEHARYRQALAQIVSCKDMRTGDYDPLHENCMEIAAKALKGQENDE